MDSRITTSFAYLVHISLAALRFFIFFFFNDTATTEIYTLSLHDALPIWRPRRLHGHQRRGPRSLGPGVHAGLRALSGVRAARTDRKSTRLNSSHSQISYAVFCLKKKNGRQFPLRAAGRDQPAHVPCLAFI